MDLKKRLKSKVVFGLLLGLVLAFGLTLPLDGTTQKIIVQASSNSSLSMSSSPPSLPLSSPASLPMSSSSLLSTSEFTFVPINGTEVDVRLADRTVTEANIPSKATVNGVEYTVAAIAANSFSTASNLERVRLPDTIKTIGMAAFANSSKLTSLTLPEGVVTINANAFMNTKLEHLIIPKSTTTIGATILRGNSTKVYARAAQASSGWNATWNNNNAITTVDFGSGFTPEIEYVHTGTGYMVRSFQPFVSQDDLDVHIPAFFEGEFVESIEYNAFNFNNARSITIGYHETSVKIGDMAFAFLTNIETIIINRDVIFESEWGGPSMMQFADSSMETVLLPATITEIPDFAFSFGDPNDSNLTDIRFITPQLLTEADEQALADDIVSDGIVYLPKTVKSIGADAFTNVTGITELYIHDEVQYVGYAAFNGWESSQTLYIDFPGLISNWDGWWDYLCDADIEYITRYTVTYAPNQPADASSDVIGETPASRPIIGKPSPLSQSEFSLTGWHVIRWNTKADGTGTQYPLESTINVPSATTSTVVELYAQWAPNTYTIIYDSNGPDGASSPQGSMIDSTLNYDDPTKLTKNEFSLDGYDFLGWSTTFDGDVLFMDEHLTPNVTSTIGATVTLYAIWGEGIKNIFTAEEFNNIRNNQSGHYRLMASFSLSSFSPWVPIPNFTGILEGMNQSISFMSISYTIPTDGLNENVNLGLFAEFNGVVSDLKLSGFSISTTNEVQTGDGWLRAGLFAGTIGLDANIYNVNFVNQACTVTINRNMSEAGLFAGQMTGGTVYRVSSSAMSFRITGQGHLGGFVGVMRGGSLINCRATNSSGMLIINYTRNTNDRGVGFLVGKIESADVIADNGIAYARFNILNAPGGTLFGILAGIGGPESANDWGYDPFYGPSQYYGTNYLGYWNNLVKIGDGSYATVNQVPFGRTY